MARTVTEFRHGLYRCKGDGTTNYWVSYTINGGRIRESAKTSDKETANRFLAERVVGSKVPVEASSGHLLNGFIDDCRVNGQDVEWCRTYVEKHIRPVLGDLKAERLDKASVKAFITKKLG